MALSLVAGAVVAPAVVDSGSLGVPEAQAVSLLNCDETSYWSSKNYFCVQRISHVNQVGSNPNDRHYGPLVGMGSISDLGICWANATKYGVTIEGSTGDVLRSM
jgi:hypothetical protein